MLFPIISEDNFNLMFNDLINNGFWCLQTDSQKEAYSYVRNYESIRFARTDQLFPNMECTPIDKTRKSKYYEFTHPINIKIEDFDFKAPQIEFEILYKEIVLAGEKDVKDALHLRNMFKDYLSKKIFDECERVILEDKNGKTRAKR
jgi:hypothetical protein